MKKMLNQPSLPKQSQLSGPKSSKGSTKKMTATKSTKGAMKGTKKY